MQTHGLWKRVALGAGLVAVLLAAGPQAMAEGRFRLPYGDGYVPPNQHYAPPQRAYSDRFGPGPGGGRTSADLALTNTSTPNPAVQGGRFAYALKVTNAGPAPTTDVSVTDQLPTGVRLVDAAASQGVCSVGGQQYVRCLIGTIDGGRDATVTLTVTAVRAGTIYNTASAFGREYDPYEGNNSATATTSVRAGQSGADLAMGNTADKARAAEGEDITYTLTVANGGPMVAQGVHLSDPLPQGFGFVSAAPSQGTCTPSATDVVCELGDLASAASATVTLILRAGRSGTAVNTAYVTSWMYDPNTADNQASATTEVGPAGGSPAPAPSPLPPLRPPSRDSLF